MTAVQQSRPRLTVVPPLVTVVDPEPRRSDLAEHAPAGPPAPAVDPAHPPIYAQLASLYDLFPTPAAGSPSRRAGIAARTARRLATLDAEWHVLHAVPAGPRGADVDHLVVGPGGVFTVTTPAGDVRVAGETVLVDGRRTRHVRTSRLTARRVRRLLGAELGASVPVTAVTAVIAAPADTLQVTNLQPTRRPADDVVVVDARRLARHLRALPPVLGANEVLAIFAAARRSTTWTPGPGPRRSR